jgi:acyl dehydratase
MKPFSKPLPVLGKEHFVRFASVVGDFNPIHYDRDFAQAFLLKLPGVVAQGPLVVLLAMDALASEGCLPKSGKLSARISGPVFADMELVFEGSENGEFRIHGNGKAVLTGVLSP